MTNHTGPQVRAAQAWADLSDTELAKQIGVSVRTLSRLKNGAYLSRERCAALAEATGVPEWFVTTGFDGVAGPDQPQILERLESLENRMDTIFEIALSRIGTDLGSLPKPGEGSEAERNVDRPR